MGTRGGKSRTLSIATPVCVPDQDRMRELLGAILATVHCRSCSQKEFRCPTQAAAAKLMKSWPPIADILGNDLSRLGTDPNDA